MLQRGKVCREKTPTIDDIVDHLLAPLYVRGFLGLPVDKTFAAQLMERLLKNTPT